MIVPSLIADSQTELNERFEKIKKIAKCVHLDVMDGTFVPSTHGTFDFVLRHENIEAHLMVQDPFAWIEAHADKVALVIAHIEAVDDKELFIEKVREKGKQVGFALNPDTPTHELQDIVNEIDQVLIMTVNPGFYGAEFLPQTIEKIREVKQLAPWITVEVDGGISPLTIKQVVDAGADKCVVGSFLQNAKDTKKAYEELKEAL